MQRTIIAAGCLLAIQLVLVAALNINSKSYVSSPPNSPFVIVSKELLSSIKITDGQGSELVLQKDGEKWKVENSFSAFADQGQVVGLIDKLTEIKQGFVVATSGRTAKRFKVSEDSFERHLIFSEGDEEVANFYLGSSPGFRQMHARKAGSNEIITISLSSFEVETSVDSWLDKEILKHNEDEIVQITFQDYALKKENGVWLLEELQETEKPDEEKINNAVKKVAGLTIKSVLDPKEVSDKFSEDSAELTYSLRMTEGREVSYTFVKFDEKRYGVKSSEDDHYYLVNSLVVENIKKIDRQSLLVNKNIDKPESSEAID